MTRRASETTSSLTRWGNGLGLRIPQEAVNRLKLKAGDCVRIRVTADAITLRCAAARKKRAEAELLHGITPDLCGPDLIPNRAGRELL